LAQIVLLFCKFSEIDESESHVGNVDTLLDKIDQADLANNTGFIFAPGEGQRPISLYNDWPDIFTEITTFVG
jgi:hypothetical protein